MPTYPDSVTTGQALLLRDGGTNGCPNGIWDPIEDRTGTMYY
jgi:hypothetical protein